MISDLKSYPVYKNSGVPWLGDLPEGIDETDEALEEEA